MVVSLCFGSARIYTYCRSFLPTELFISVTLYRRKIIRMRVSWFRFFRSEWFSRHTLNSNTWWFWRRHKDNDDDDDDDCCDVDSDVDDIILSKLLELQTSYSEQATLIIRWNQINKFNFIKLWLNFSCIILSIGLFYP